MKVGRDEKRLFLDFDGMICVALRLIKCVVDALRRKWREKYSRETTPLQKCCVDLDQQMEKRADDDASLHVPLDEIKVDKTLRFVEEPVENSDREVKRLKCSRIVVVKIIREVFVKLLLDSFGKLSIREFMDLFGSKRDRLREFMDLFGSKRDRLITVSFMRILRLREVARMTARIALELAPEFV
ncbi:hypothetical protein Tco_0743396 [Tanacetum coccineum]